MGRLKDYTNGLLKTGAGLLLAVEDHNDPEITKSRLSICKACPNYDPENQTCKVCGCFLEVKATLKTNLNPKKGFRTEITHCPHGHWEDHETANIYRQMDGLPLFTNY